jgi:hypothetical protein
MTAASVFGAAYTLVTPYDVNEIWDVQYAQYDNSMYLASPDDPPQLLTRTAHNNWTLTDLSTHGGCHRFDYDHRISYDRQRHADRIDCDL